MMALHGKNINLFIEPGPPLGPILLEVTVEDLGEAKRRLVENGCEVVKDEPEFPQTYIKDPFGLIYNITE
jgi:predicted enzyme related to lactoylglutathione lyase